MAAIVGCIVDEPCAELRVEMTVTGTRGRLAVTDDDVGHNAVIGHPSDLDRNLVGPLSATPDLLNAEIAASRRARQMLVVMNRAA